MTDLSALKVYSPGYQATEWGFGYDQIVDLETALAQPYPIAVVPVYYDRPQEFSYVKEFAGMPIHKFRLVLFTEIEWRSQKELLSWIQTTGVDNWLLHTAGLWLDETPDPRVFYRPAWTFNLLRWNTPRDDFPMDREFEYECLLGARRRHRDYTMLFLQRSGLINRGLVTYRDVFLGHWIDHTPQDIQDRFPDTTLCYPYVSAALDPAWEVKTQMDNSVSGLVPWEIYNRTWFSVVCETLGQWCDFGRIFLSAEKTAKCFMARRLFVVFAIPGFLQHYKNWGFETFGDVIDETYDSVEDDLERWDQACQQIQYLCDQNMPALMTKLKPQLDHNHHRLYQLDQEMRQNMHQLIAETMR